MAVRTFQEQGIQVVAMAGNLDAVTAPELESVLDECIQSGTTALVLDLSETDYVSSAGLRVILKAAKDLYGKGSFALSGPQEAVQEVLEMTGFDEIIPIHQDVDGALQAVSSAAK